VWLEQLGGSGMACMDTVLGELAETAATPTTSSG
jgi:hypothetical protein